MNAASTFGSRGEKIVRRLVPFISLGVLGNLAFSYFTTDQNQFNHWRQLSPGWFLIALGLSLLPWAWHCVRLRIWTHFFDTAISWRQLLTIVVSTDVGSAVSPTAVGGAPLKLAMLTRYGMRPGQATLLTLIGNLEDALFFVFAIPISIWLTDGWENPLLSKAGSLLLENITLILWALAGITLVFLFLKRWLNNTKRFTRKGWKMRLLRLKKDFAEAAKLVKKSGWKPLTLSMVALFGQWLSKFSVLVAVFLALGIEVDFIQIMLLQWMVYFAILLVPTPGATGGAEAAFLFVYNGMIPAGKGSVAMATWRLVTYYFMLVVAVVLFVLLTNNQKYKTGKKMKDQPDIKPAHQASENSNQLKETIDFQ
ncbi:MAG: lysylphosphatidylglycerol synthase transmembrane domain-containing protein [Bacteroidota bacterium]